MALAQKRSFVSTGGFGQLIFLFFPILVITFSNYFFLLVEKLLLARFSVQAMEAAVNATYACQIFQLSSIAIAMMAQVYVGRWGGAQEFKSIGPGMWQFIWFSFLSMLLIAPCSMLYGKWYFEGTDIEKIVLPYFYFLVSINFLFPLAASLSCFYLGRGKTRLVLLATLGSQFLKLTLAYFLIFGWDVWIPSLGIMGGAVSTLIAQGGLCVLLFCVFLQEKYAEKYHSRDWRFRPKLFWECMHPSLLRAGNRVLCALCWASIAGLMTAKGGNYLLILSIGGTLFLFLPFLGEAICQAQTTIVSNILGAKNYHLMNTAFRSGFILVLIAVIGLSIPFLVFPIKTFYSLFPDVLLDEVMIRKVFLGIWASFAFFTYTFLLISYTLAFKDTKFSLLMGAGNWINGFLLVYLAIEKMNMAADQFWLIISVMHGSSALLYFWRMKWLQAKLAPLEKEVLYGREYL